MVQIIKSNGGGGGTPQPSYTAGTGIDITSNVISIDEDVVQTVGNMVDNLTGADDDHYPTAKAVADAISGGGSGDVIGPNSSTDGDIVLFDGATGKIIKDSGVGLSSKLDASALSDNNYGGAWNGDTTHTPTKNALYTKIHTMDVEIGNKAADNTVVKLSGNQTINGTKTFGTSPVVPSKTTDATNTGTAIATEAQVYNVEQKIPSVIDDLTSTSATDALSANQGKVLNDKISNLFGLGKFLSLWDSTTGLPTSFPLSTPYTYTTGDYYMVEEAYPNLPVGYTLLDYVTFSGTEILDTGLILNQDSKIESKFIGDTDNCWIYGTGSSNPRITAYLASTGNQRFGNVSVGNTGIDKNILYTLIQDKTGFDLNGDKKTYSGVGTFTCTASLTIGNSNGSTGTPYFDGNFYYMKIWNDGELAMHLVACKDSNNVVGMYDIIGNTFYEPTTGTLIAGNEINNYKPTGSSYSGTASTVVETEDIQIGDIYIYDGTNWLLQLNHGKTVSFSEIAGNATDNTSLNNALATKADDNAVVKLTGDQTIAGTKTFSTSPVVPSKTAAATNTGTAIATEAQVKLVADDVATINGMISSNASSSNKLMDKNYIDDSINSVTAYYITKNAQGDQWATYTELSTASTFYSGGVARTPTRNDYTIVLADENHDNATTRYIYNSGWEYQYTVNETALSQAQLDALNSGITSGKVSTYDGYATTISGKQDALTLPATPTQGNLVAWGSDNKSLTDGGAIPTGVPSGGNNGDVLTNVSGTPTWSAPSGGDVMVSSQSGNILTSGMKIWAGTEADYGNLGTYDNNTVYLTF